MSPLDRIMPSRLDRWAEHEQTAALAWAFREACIGAGVSLAVDAPVAGTSQRAPAVTRVDLGPPTVLTVRMLPGQEPAQLTRVGRLIAPHLGGVALRVADRGHGWAVVTVLAADPLAGSLPLHLPDWCPDILIGRTEDRGALRVRPEALPHMIVQGQTRSGKSTWLYGLLAQLAGHPLVAIAGVDPSGITLRPFRGTRHGHRLALGLADLDAIEYVLAELVRDMDARLAAMPPDRDVLPISDRYPLLVIVLEEWPGVLRALDVADAKQGKRVRASVARLLAESHKVGHRIVMACQRAEATIVGAAERAQCGGRLSFTVDGTDSVRLLHPGAEHLAEDHTTAAPGIALCSWPGRPVTRLRGPYLGDYSDYAASVAAALTTTTTPSPQAPDAR